MIINDILLVLIKQNNSDYTCHF